MQMCARRVARTPGISHCCAGADARAARHGNAGQVRVKGLVSIAVIDHDGVPVAAVCPAGKHDHPCVRGPN